MARSALGAPVGLSGISGWLICIFFLALFVIGIVYVCTTSYARKETVTGQVTSIAGAPHITSIRGGVVDRVLVIEGQAVVSGQTLFSILSTPKLAQGTSLSTGLQQIHQEQVSAHLAQVEARLGQIQRQRQEIIIRKLGVVSDIERQIASRALQVERIHIQEQATVAMHKLGEQGLMPALNVRAKDEALIEARQSLERMDREIAQQKNLTLQLGAQLDRLFSDERMVRSESGAIDAQMAEKRLNAEAAYADHITSPSDGIVTALQVKNGSAINGNQTLAIIVPTSTQNQGQGQQTASGMEVELWAASRAIGFVKPGTKVRLMIDAFPYQSFGVGTGVVKDIALAPVLPSEQISANANGNREPLYRIRVKLDQESLMAYGRQWPLVPGMSLSADLVLEERSLLDWLLEPLLASKRRAGS
jgi:membrane fusion protein